MAVTRKRTVKKTAPASKKKPAAPKAAVKKKAASVKKSAAPRRAAPKTKPETTRAQSMQRTVVDALADAKAQDAVTLDVRKRTDVTDYMVIASGTSTRHVASIADKVTEKMKASGFRPLGSEGKGTGEWVLIDFGDVVVHVMHPQTRDFYNLEKLWGVDLPDADNGQQSELEHHIRGRRAGR